MKKMWFQMGIRELLGLVTILALGIALYLSNRDNQDMRARYSQLLPKLSLVVPVCLETRYVNGASISVMGTLFHSKDERWRLRDRHVDLLACLFVFVLDRLDQGLTFGGKLQIV